MSIISHVLLAKARVGPTPPDPRQIRAQQSLELVRHHAETLPDLQPAVGFTAKLLVCIVIA